MDFHEGVISNYRGEVDLRDPIVSGAYSKAVEINSDIKTINVYSSIRPVFESIVRVYDQFRKYKSPSERERRETSGKDPSANFGLKDKLNDAYKDLELGVGEELYYETFFSSGRSSQKINIMIGLGILPPDIRERDWTTKKIQVDGRSKISLGYKIDSFNKLLFEHIENFDGLPELSRIVNEFRLNESSLDKNTLYENYFRELCAFCLSDNYHKQIEQFSSKYNVDKSDIRSGEFNKEGWEEDDLEILFLYEHVADMTERVLKSQAEGRSNHLSENKIRELIKRCLSIEKCMRSGINKKKEELINYCELNGISNDVRYVINNLSLQ